ncbi:MAG: hypothetical protein IPG71_14290 [bacterium]|nr:hypothetical protein [bacterium]
MDWKALPESSRPRQWERLSQSDILMDRSGKKSTLSIGRAKQQDVFNEFVLKYRNIGGEFDGVRYVINPMAG